MTTFDWSYYVLRADGLLADETGQAPFTVPTYSVPAQPLFTKVWEAEDWLHTYDIRGNVKGQECGRCNILKTSGHLCGACGEDV